jgi:hypothetical protein
MRNFGNWNIACNVPTEGPVHDFTETFDLDEEVEETVVSDVHEEEDEVPEDESPFVSVVDEGTILIEDFNGPDTLVLDKETAGMLVRKLLWAIDGVDELSRIGIL